MSYTHRWHHGATQRYATVPVPFRSWQSGGLMWYLVLAVGKVLTFDLEVIPALTGGNLPDSRQHRTTRLLPTGKHGQTIRGGFKVNSRARNVRDWRELAANDQTARACDDAPCAPARKLSGRAHQRTLTQITQVNDRLRSFRGCRACMHGNESFRVS
jgi:hypothetical protein